MAWLNLSQCIDSNEIWTPAFIAPSLSHCAMVVLLLNNPILPFCSAAQNVQAVTGHACASESPQFSLSPITQGSFDVDAKDARPYISEACILDVQADSAGSNSVQGNMDV